MRFLCISDIQGNAMALSAVLATAERRGYDQLLVAGDLCFPGPEPLEVWRRLLRAKAVCVQGASDKAISTLDPDALTPKDDHERERYEQLLRVREELGPQVLGLLGELQDAARIKLPDGRELLLIHGSPFDPFESFSLEMTDEEILALVSDDPADIIVCGGSHVPFDRDIAGVRIINVGSVGEAPTAGGPRHADAVFIEVTATDTTVEHFVVPLEEEAA